MAARRIGQLGRWNDGVRREADAGETRLQAVEGREEFAGVLGIDQSTDDLQRFGVARLQFIDEGAQGAGGMRVVAAVQP